MNPTLTDIVISVVAFGMFVVALVAFVRWVTSVPDEWAREARQQAEREHDGGARELEYPVTFHSALHNAPVHSHIVYWPTEIERRRESQQHKRRLPIACPLCLDETWKTPGSRIPEHYPRYIPVLCDRHTPTIITPVVRLPQPQQPLILDTPYIDAQGSHQPHIPQGRMN